MLYSEGSKWEDLAMYSVESAPMSTAVEILRRRYNLRRSDIQNQILHWYWVYECIYMYILYIYTCLLWMLARSRQSYQR